MAHRLQNVDDCWRRWDEFGVIFLLHIDVHFCKSEGEN